MAVVVPAALLAVVAVEVALARRAPMLDDLPLELGGRVGEGAAPVLRALWLGDSTAAGVGASGAMAALPTLVAEGLGRPVELSVVARSGATVADVVDDQLPLARSGLSPEVIFVSVGANDVTDLTSRADFEESYSRLVQGLPDGARVVVLGVPDMGAIPRLAQPLRALAGWRGQALDRVVRSVAQASASAYVDIGGETGPAFRAQPRRFFAGDDFHPSDEGYRRWADAVLDVARPVVGPARAGPARAGPGPASATTG
ncbi:MAG: SGNH/GDSL hydrolase family protein [Acidimicrobiales bacterium]